MKRVIRFAAVLLSLVLLAGCIQIDILVKVKPDGSGTVEESILITRATMQQVETMMKGMAEQMQMKGIQPEKGLFEKDLDLLDEAQFQKSAADMGEGVTHVSAEKITTDDARGYRAIYAFSDINKLRLNANPSDKAPPGLGSAAGMPAGKDAFVRFRFNDGPPAVLRVIMPEGMTLDDLSDLPSTQALGPMKADDPRAAMVADKMKELFQGMKVSLSLEMEGGIVRTNATHRQGERITLAEVSFDKLFEDQENLKKFGKQRPKNIEEAKKLLKELPGIKVELNPELKIEFAAVQPLNPKYWFKMGAICYTYGNPKAAITYFEKTIEIDPGNAPAYFNQGVCYAETGEYEEAISSINRAIEITPEKGSYFYGRGWTYLLAGDKEKAVEDLKHAAELGDTDAQAYLLTILQGK